MLLVSGLMIFAVLPSIIGLFLLVILYKDINKFFIYVFIFISILILYTHIFWEMKFYQPLYFFFCSLTLGFFMSKGNIIKEFALCFFMVLACYFIYKFSTSVNLNTDVFNASSRNYISMLLIFSSLYVFYSTASPLVKNLVFFISFVLCFFAGGRSGVVTSFLIFLFFQFEFKNKKYLVLSLFCFIVGVFVIYQEFNEEISLLIERFLNKGIADEARGLVINCYINNFNINSIFFGLNSNQGDYCGTLAIGAYSTHNSMISLLTNSGVLSLVIFTPLIISLTHKRYILEGVIILSYLARSLSDSILFYTYFDAIYWCYFFRVLSDFKISNRKRG